MAKKDKKNTNKADEMFKYTYRDVGQEYIMQKKMIRAIVAFIITLVALAVFIALYIDEKKRVQETYRIQYMSCIESVLYDIESYDNAEGDYDFRYRRIVADMNSVSSFAFLLNDFEDQKKTMNELYTVFLKYPEQMSTKMDEAHQALSDIYANLDKGYDEANELIGSIDLKGY